ncbi:unnamed protein product [Plutella xylostella]|uniref:Dynactin subunit 4 n=1 Tax=Plutella xylostella TaxID=51655 RepID=A0A8S4G991_PLUXY|nr:unnamed protein product [Plutella xylostella]
MAYLTQPDYVTYVCSCGQLKPITSLYFCRHCLQIRCGFCICHEVDSHYCANCLENMPSSEARLKKNRCSSCFDCPSCFHTLSTRATLAQQRQSQEAAAAGDAKVENKASKKMYYLSCFNCRWTSRDVGIPDQPVASGGWPERTHPHAARLAALLEHCRAISQLEKQDRLEKERKKFTIRGKYITLTDKTGLTSAMARSLAGMPAEGAPAAGFPPSVAEEEVEGLPEDFYTKEVDLKQSECQCLKPINNPFALACSSGYKAQHASFIGRETASSGEGMRCDDECHCEDYFGASTGLSSRSGNSGEVYKLTMHALKVHSRRCDNSVLQDKTGLTGAMARSLAGMPAEGAPAAGFPPSVAEEEMEGLPEDFYTREVDLKQSECLLLLNVSTTNQQICQIILDL